MKNLFFGGPIITLSEPLYADAMLTDGGRVLALGSLDALRAAAPGARETDLRGRTLAPAFIDAHSHFTQMANSLLQVSVDGADSVEKLRARIAGFMEETALRPGEILRAVRIPATFLLVALGWVLFRAPSLHHASRFYRILFAIHPPGSGLSAFPELIADRALWLAAAIGIPCALAPALRLDRWLPRDPDDPDQIPLSSLLLRFAASLLFFVIAAGELCASGFNPFIYFQF